MRILAVVVAAAMIAACGEQISDSYVIENQPYSLEDLAGSELKLVRLEEGAVERIGIEIGEVTTAGAGLAVPSRALWMDTGGVFWVYTSPEPAAYLRHEVTVTEDDGETALLASGPPAGTAVVIAGVPELFGTEVGVGK